MTDREPRHVIIQRGEPPMRIELPDGIGYVEIRTDGINGPTGYPVIGVDVVSETKYTDAADGRRYWPQHGHDCGVVLIGEPGRKIHEQPSNWTAQASEAHHDGDHSQCPSTCPAVIATAGH